MQLHASCAKQQTGRRLLRAAVLTTSAQFDERCTMFCACLHTLLSCCLSSTSAAATNSEALAVQQKMGRMNVELLAFPGYQACCMDTAGHMIQHIRCVLHGPVYLYAGITPFASVHVQAHDGVS
jgi:hypothetical protein